MPDDVRLTLPEGRPVAEDRSPVRSPGHLEHAWASLDALYPQARAKATATPQVGDELLHCASKRSALVGREIRVVVDELPRTLERGQRALLVESGEELLVRLEAFSLARLDLLYRARDALLPGT
jgi:hypothetical protein